jgi:hypothetical protein
MSNKLPPPEYCVLDEYVIKRWDELPASVINDRSCDRTFKDNWKLAAKDGEDGVGYYLVRVLKNGRKVAYKAPRFIDNLLIAQYTFALEDVYAEFFKEEK